MTLRTLTVALVFMALGPVSAQRAPGQAGAGLADAPSLADYVIGARDVLVITSYDDGELSGKFSVETDGTFTFPMLGRIEAGGLTLRQMESTLRKRLIDAGLFINPVLTVTIDQYRSQKVFVLGEVRKPGVYPLSGAMHLVEVLALADSTLPTAGGDIVIIPATDGPSFEEGRAAARVNLRDLQEGRGRNVTLRDGDTILVPRAENVYVFGQVKNPGAYPVHDDDMTVLQALSLAGGVTDRGSTGRLEIVRVVEGERREVDAELTDVVQPGDTIVVPERYF